MNWFTDLILGGGIAHSVLVLALVITLGISLGKVKIGGISLGITWILFVGIAAGHFGLVLEPHLLHFVKEFGLILFVYSVGLQVGPGFFSSFKKGGVTLNAIALLVVILSCTIAYIIHIVTGTDLVTMIGVLSGAVTNTPGLGAAQQTYTDITGDQNASIALGYAVAYPLGVIGIIFSIVIIKSLFGIKLEQENEKIRSSADKDIKAAKKYSIVVKNGAVFGKNILELHDLIGKDFVVSRLCRKDGKIEIPTSASTLEEDDKILVISNAQNRPSIITFVGKELNMTFDSWIKMDTQLALKKIVITKPNINGKTLEELKVRSVFGVNITRVTRAGIDLVAAGDLELQMGDRVLVVGDEKDIDSLAKVLGNSTKQLREPNLIAIFFGIAVGVFFGSIPFMIPGIPQPVKLGLAGGPLIIAILISRFGYKLKIVTYTTQSANLMLREIGISLFLAAVGIGAGEGFVNTIVNNGGYIWIGYGVIITILPLLIGAAVGRFIYKLNYYTLMGLMAGCTTDPPALAYSNATAPNSYPAVAYATVYPFVMFLRVLTAQVLMLFAL
ncbi:MAG: putative transporter [Bacteroidales bacterium]